MDAIPWYKSPVMVSAVVAIISQVLVVLGKADLVSADVLTQKVEAVFQIIAIASGLWTVIARARSKVQPIALTKAGAEQQKSGGDGGQAQCSPVAIALISALVFLAPAMLLGGCQSFAIGHAQTTEQKAAALLGDFTLYQRASLKIGEDQTVPVEVRRAVLEAETKAKPFADKLDESLREYRVIAAELANGQSTDEKLRIAAANLTSWIQQLEPLVRSLRSTVEGATS